MMPRRRTLQESLNLIGTRFQPFPNVAVGSYCSLSQSLRLEGFADEDVIAALRGGSTAALRVMPVLMHECQHMVDHLCTLFGRKLLASTYDAIEARLSGRNSLFTAVADLFRTVGEIHRNDYFFELGPGADVPRKSGVRWMYRFSTGLQLDVDGRELADRPIFFVQFDHPEGGRVARVPMTIAALLEARAMAAEMRTKLKLAESISHPIERKIYLATVESELDAMLYDPFFVKYTVAAHTAANLLGGNNLIVALELASRLAWLCLMMPAKLFDRVQIPKYSAGEEFDSVEADRRTRAGLSRRDRGHLFLVLITNLAQRGGHMDIDNVVGEALEASGLPSLAQVMGLAGCELVEASRSTTGGRYSEQYGRVTALGDALVVDPFKDGVGVLTQLPGTLPPLVLRNVGPYLHGTAAWTSDQHLEWADACGSVTNRFSEFVEACGLYR